MLPALCLLTLGAGVDCPEPPAWPTDLPAPTLAECGTCLPGRLADATMARLLYLDQYPDLCRLALGARGEVCTVEIEQAKKIAKADCLAVQATKTGGWEWKPWTAALTIGAAALSGVAVGIVVGMTAWR